MYQIKDNCKKTLDIEDIKFTNQFYIVSSSDINLHFALLVFVANEFYWINLIANRKASRGFFSIREAIEFEFQNHNDVFAFEDLDEFTENLAMYN